MIIVKTSIIIYHSSFLGFSVCLLMRPWWLKLGNFPISQREPVDHFCSLRGPFLTSSVVVPASKLSGEKYPSCPIWDFHWDFLISILKKAQTHKVCFFQKFIWAKPKIAKTYVFAEIHKVCINNVLALRILIFSRIQEHCKCCQCLKRNNHNVKKYHNLLKQHYEVWQKRWKLLLFTVYIIKLWNGPGYKPWNNEHNGANLLS